MKQTVEVISKDFSSSAVCAKPLCVQLHPMTTTMASHAVVLTHFAAFAAV